MDSIHISPLKGRVEIRNLIVGNPEGYASEHAIKLGFVNAELDIASAFSDKLIIRECTLKDINVNYETKLLSSNIQQIIDNVNTLAGTAEKDPAEKENPEQSKNQKLQVDLFELQNVGVHVLVNGMGTAHGAGVAVTINPLKDLGKDEQGITPAELIVKVLTSILTDSAEQGILTVSETISDATKAVGTEVQNLLKQTDSTVKDLSKSADGLKSGLQGLLTGKKEKNSEAPKK